jgi:histidinol dehydrogenase
VSDGRPRASIGARPAIELRELQTVAGDVRQHLLRRSRVSLRGVRAEVEAIVEDVERRGDAALCDYIRRFDRVDLRPDQLRVSQADLERAPARLPSNVLDVLRRQIAISRRFHEAQRRPEQWEVETAPGVHVGQRSLPIDSVGLYVPGGRASYPTVMQILAVPASVAGVDSVVAATPPAVSSDGSPGPRDEVLAAAALSGVRHVYRMGGPAAIAALAYGTESVDPVHKIVGPGNIYVQAAKLLVFGDVAIDQVAGPSEVLVLADESANPTHVAADLLAQAEHDPQAAAVLVTWSRPLAEATLAEVERQLPLTPRCEIVAHALAAFGMIIVARSEAEAVAFSNDYAPEHLEVLTARPSDLLPRLRHAGSVFLGGYAPVAVGDYASGSNHVLPTGQGARFFSPVSVDTYLKTSQYQTVSREGLRHLSDIITTLAEIEGLPAHAASVRVRLND